MDNSIANKLEDSHELSRDEEDSGLGPADLPLKKRIFYAAMVKTFGNIHQSCMVTSIKPATYRRWLKEDELFNKLINDGDFENRLVDFAESKLVKKIEEGDIIAILFTLKTRGKKRGYVEGKNEPVKPDENKVPSWFDEPKKKLPEISGTDNVEEAEEIKKSKDD